MVGVDRGVDHGVSPERVDGEDAIGLPMRRQRLRQERGRASPVDADLDDVTGLRLFRRLSERVEAVLVEKRAPWLRHDLGGELREAIDLAEIDLLGRVVPEVVDLDELSAERREPTDPGLCRAGP